MLVQVHWFPKLKHCRQSCGSHFSLFYQSAFTHRVIPMTSAARNAVPKTTGVAQRTCKVDGKIQMSTDRYGSTDLDIEIKDSKETKNLFSLKIQPRGIFFGCVLSV